VGWSSSVENIDYSQRQVLNVEEKKSIARRVASMIPDGKSLIINIGTTTEEVAKCLAHHKRLSVVTNNLNVAAILSANPDCEVIVAGGVVRHRDRGITGEATIDFIKQFKVDIGIIGVSAIEPDGTLRDFDYREVKVAQTIIEQSRQVWMVADHTKFEREALVRLGHISQVDVLFTDAPVPEHLVSVLRDAKTVVHVGDRDGVQDAANEPQIITQ
jgi:DeoR family glycerol-3-phosphate regulon repressor